MGSRSYPLQLAVSGVLALCQLWSCDFVCASDSVVSEGHAALADVVVSLSLRSGPAVETLHEFSAQTGVGVVSASDELRGVTTRTVSGRHRIEEALELLLEDTGLTYEVVDERTITIVLAENTEASEDSSIGPPVRRSAYEAKPAPPREWYAQDSPAHLKQVVIMPASDPESEDSWAPAIAVFDRNHIDSSGDFTVESLLRNQPQIFGGGATEDTSIGREAQSNVMRGYGINLRGLDAAETLVLLNGRRMAPSGTLGSFVDVSNIPLSAVERIDLLPPGAEPPYGADGAGGVVNFTMRDDFVGAQAETRLGSVTKGALQERQYSVLLGTPLTRWTVGNAMFAFEYDSRDALAAADRSQATSNFLPWGGQDYDIPYGNPGNIVTANGLYPIPHGQNGQSLLSSQLVAGTPNTYDRFLGATILPYQRRLSALGAIKFEFDDHIKAYLDVLANERIMASSYAAETSVLTVPPQNPSLASNGITDPVQVLYGFGSDLGPERVRGTAKTLNTAAGLSWDTEAWHLSGYLGYTLEASDELTTGLVNFTNLDIALGYKDPGTAFNPFGDGSFTNSKTLAFIRASNGFASNSHLETVHVGAEHDLAALSAGALKLQMGFDHRDQVFNSHLQQVYPSNDTRVDASRSVESGYAQLRAPLFGPGSRHRWLERLDLSAAIRLDHYSDVGTAYSPTYGASWSPVSGLLLRSTFSKTFRAPNLSDRVEQTDVSAIGPVPESAGSSQSINALLWAGNNAALGPERSRSWTVGGTLEPTLVPDSSLALTYFDILFRDKIDNAVLSQDGLADPALVGRVITSPSQALRTQACQYADDPQQCATTPIDAIIDLRLHNTTVVRTRGIDMLAKFDRAVTRGNVGLQVEGTYLFQYTQSYALSDQMIGLLNTQNNPVSLRLHSSAHWRYRDFTISQEINYTKGYRDTATVPAGKVGPWITTDLNFSYSPHQTDLGWASGMTLFLGVQNLFDRYPPFLDNRNTWIGYDQENGDLLGRFVSIGIRKNW